MGKFPRNKTLFLLIAFKPWFYTLKRPRLANSSVPKLCLHAPYQYPHHLRPPFILSKFVSTKLSLIHTSSTLFKFLSNTTTAQLVPVNDSFKYHPSLPVLSNENSNKCYPILQAKTHERQLSSRATIEVHHPKPTPTSTSPKSSNIPRSPTYHQSGDMPKKHTEKHKYHPFWFPEDKQVEGRMYALVSGRRCASRMEMG